MVLVFDFSIRFREGVGVFLPPLRKHCSRGSIWLSWWKFDGCWQVQESTFTAATEIKVKLIPREYFVAFALALIRVAQEPNRNRKPEPSEPFLQELKVEPEPPEPFSRKRKRNRNRPLCETVLKHTKNPSLEEPPEPKTGTARTVPSPNRNRTEPNRGHPDWC